MTRYEFLKNLGLTGSALFAVTCLGGLQACGNSSEEDPQPTPNANQVILDLTQAANANLRNVGGSVILTDRRIVVARVAQDRVVAVTQVCSHQQNPNVSFNANANEFQCSVHGARFNTQGQGLNANGSNGLRVFTSTLDVAGNRVTISLV
ncbi:MAG: Rieske (2Fe-2S) protein [Bernardetiaceae bacterium]|jgi:nitrite reductase/ring-hydroxylating ferredoxin subunit|nr:Rieske (2Fe-2S) protein [Bernardetiaceae bacterium]